MSVATRELTSMSRVDNKTHRCPLVLFGVSFCATKLREHKKIAASRGSVHFRSVSCYEAELLFCASRVVRARCIAGLAALHSHSAANALLNSVKFCFLLKDRLADRETRAMTKNASERILSCRTANS